MSNIPNIVFLLIFIQAFAWIIVLTGNDRKVIEIIRSLRDIRSGRQASEYLNRLQFPDEKFSPHEMALLTDLFVSDTNNIRAGTWDELADLGVIDENENGNDQAAAAMHGSGAQDDK